MHFLLFPWVEIVKQSCMQGLKINECVLQPIFATNCVEKNEGRCLIIDPSQNWILFHLFLDVVQKITLSENILFLKIKKIWVKKEKFEN